VDEFYCVTVKSEPGEAEERFKQRLTEFWTAILREIPDEFEKVYAETIEFESEKGRVCRRYAIETDAAELFATKLRQGGFHVDTFGDDDLYTKPELPATEWWQIEH